MNRQRIAFALVALLCVLGFAVGGTALESAATTGGTIGGGDGGGDGGDRLVRSDSTASGRVGIPPVILYIVWAAIVTAMLALLVYRGVLDRRDAAAMLLTAVFVTALVFGLLGSAFPEPPDRDQNASMAGALGNGTSSEGAPKSADQRTDLSVPLPLLALLAGTVLVAGGLVYVASRDGVTPDEVAVATEEDEDGDDRELSRVGQAAGRAADRIEAGTEEENAIYEAWREMTGALAVTSPETSTPREFERAAVDAGMDADEVATLTDLFETVRYGEAPATAERERRAREALRHIEATYGGDEA